MRSCTYHHEHLGPVGCAKCDLMIDQLNDPVVTPQSLQKLYLVGVALVGLGIRSV